MKSVETVASVGASTIGCGWTVVFLAAGFHVRMFDEDIARYEQAESKVRRSIDLLVKAGRVDSIDDAMAGLSFATSLAEAVKDVVYVQESIYEERQAKRALLETLDLILPPGAILASSTSSIPGSEFMCGLGISPRTIVAHPANPSYLVPIVELCTTEETSAKTLEYVTNLMRHIGMVPVRIQREILGYVLNRLQAAVVGEALHLVAKGYVTAKDLDLIMTAGLGRRWACSGPFLTGHLNSENGYLDYMRRYGPVYRQLIRSLDVGYDWSDEQLEQIDSELKCRYKELSRQQLEEWRDSALLEISNVRSAT